MTFCLCFSTLSLCSGPEAPVDLTAGYAWSPQCWSSRRPPSRLSAAVPALLPSVSAARFSARLGLHVCYKLLLLLHSLLGSCVCSGCILFSNVLYSGLHGSAAPLPGAQESREGEFKCIISQKLISLICLHMANFNNTAIYSLKGEIKFCFSSLYLSGI